MEKLSVVVIFLISCVSLEMDVGPIYVAQDTWETSHLLKWSEITEASSGVGQLINFCWLVSSIFVMRSVALQVLDIERLNMSEIARGWHWLAKYQMVM